MVDNSQDVSSIALHAALRQVPLFASLANEQFDCVTQGTQLWLQPGEYIVKEGEPPMGFFIQLAGQSEWTRQVGLQDVHVLTHKAGAFYGHELLLANKPCPMSGRALTAVHLYKLQPDAFWQMLSRCPLILRTLVIALVEREGTLGAVQQQHAKLVSLGTMAASLAHELNNPAAAARRAIDGLGESFEASQLLAFKLLESEAISSQCLAEIGCEVQEHTLTVPPMDSLEQNDREERIAAWLEAYRVESSWRLAPTLASAGLDIDWLETFVARVPSGTLPDLLPWIAANLLTRDLLVRAKGCTERISNLVTAVKDYSYMDRAPLLEIDLHSGLESTLTILSHKLKKGNIVIICEYDPSLPRICAYGSQLNQVWTNLLDNAIDALEGSGHIWIRTFSEIERVVVEIVDNGLGIPPQVQPHIFEPFFTTKDVGSSGLGLDIAHRIVVGQHKGDIRVFSQPGDTHFQVRVPLSPTKTT